MRGSKGANEKRRRKKERKTEDKKISQPQEPPPSITLSLPLSTNFPQGGIDHLENPLAAAARELREETGIVSARVVAISSSWLVHDSPTRVADPSRPEQPGALVSYRGQTQKWVLMYYYGEEGNEEVDLGPEDTREFSEWGWRVRMLFFPRFFFFVFESMREGERKKMLTFVLSFLASSSPPPPPPPTQNHQDLAEVAANVVPFKRHAYEAVEREFGPVIAARAARRRGEKEVEGAKHDDDSRRGWWGLSSSSSSSSHSGQQRRSLQNQILPASGVAMKRAQREQQQQR